MTNPVLKALGTQAQKVVDRLFTEKGVLIVCLKGQEETVFHCESVEHAKALRVQMNLSEIGNIQYALVASESAYKTYLQNV